ncbi:MAG: alpha/beta hydrolase, partial [Spirillospora sp.]
MREPAPRPAAPRDLAVDALRTFAILGVVLGHWLVTAFVADGSTKDLRVTSPLKTMPDLTPITWVLQTLAVFFLVGGYAAAKGLGPGEPWWPRLRRRLARFARPLPVLLVAWLPAAAVLRWTGFSTEGIRTLLNLVISPLWFLGVYVILTAATPLIAAAWNRLRLHGAVVLITATALIDLGRFALDTPGWTGWATVLTGWLVPFYLGIGWANGALHPHRAGPALLAGGATATAGLILFAGYPASMVGVPGAAVSNLSPPTLVAVSFGLAQTGLALLLHAPLTRWTRHARPQALISAAGRSAMTIFLWHQTALMTVTVGTLLTLGTLPGLHTMPDQPQWIAERLAWLGVFAAVLAAVWAVVHRYERPARGPRAGRAPRNHQAILGGRKATMPPPETVPRRPGRLRRALASAASITVVMLTTAGTGHADPYAPPVAVPTMAPSTLDVRYTAERRSIEKALKTAQEIGDTDRARAFGALLHPGRRFLYFDPRGNGRAIEVVGDITRAKRIAILIPGADTTLTTFDTRGGKPWSTPGGGAHSLYAQAQASTGSPHPDFAVVAWLGYAAPETFSGDVLTDERAREGGVRLRRFLEGVQAVNPLTQISLLCHSYGSVVCGRAASDSPNNAA